MRGTDLPQQAWHKSSYSNHAGACVEVARLGDYAAAQQPWRKSSYSNHVGNCVEVARLGVAVATRDSKDPAGPALRFGAEAWAAFVGAVADGRFDRL